VCLSLCLSPALAAAQPEYGNQGAKSCLDCHGNPRVMGILKTAHAKRENPKTPAAQKACESCHGPSATHMKFPMQVENLHFGKKSKTAAKMQNEVCIVCHAKGAEQAERDWRASAHGFENVLCSTCHAIHDPARIVPAKATVSSGCSVAGCHAILMSGAEPAASFSHAVGKNIGNQGQVTCTGCHNPHGPLSSDRCVDCHAQTAEILSKQSEKARRFHEVATREGTECIRCHKALAHPIKPLQLEQQQTIESPGAPRVSGASR
jgi:nitrate/TMAO reductase-like tetraheme cytochrome c subunit